MTDVEDALGGGYEGAGGDEEEDNTHEDGRLGEPIQGRVEKGTEGAHPVRLAGDRAVEGVEESCEEHHDAGDPRVPQPEQDGRAERQRPAQDRERVGAYPQSGEQTDQRAQELAEGFFRCLFEGERFTVWKAQLPTPLPDSRSSEPPRGCPSPSAIGREGTVAADGSSPSPVAGTRGALSQRSKIRVPRR